MNLGEFPRDAHARHAVYISTPLFQVSGRSLMVIFRPFYENISDLFMVGRADLIKGLMLTINHCSRYCESNWASDTSRSVCFYQWLGGHEYNCDYTKVIRFERVFGSSIIVLKLNAVILIQRGILVKRNRHLIQHSHVAKATTVTNCHLMDPKQWPLVP